jgi:TRAP-type C4-dicarboxylate transport system substrate-binding protein
MSLSRRTVIAGALAAPAILAGGRSGHAVAPLRLKISHQFPGGTADEGDFRDRLCRHFASEVEKRTNGALAFDIYPGSSLIKTNAQFSALRKGALDLSLLPLPYAGGEMAELNIALMPGLVTNYDQGSAWKTAAVGAELNRLLDEKGVKILAWIWQGGGVASRGAPVVVPADVKGLKVRGGSREMDLVLKAAGAAVTSLPSDEIYAAMQTGAIDAALTSSTSLISFRLNELSKSLTTARDRTYWFMLEPLLMSKAVFDTLSADQQKVVTAVGTEMEAFGLAGARADDEEVARIYAKSGAKVVDMDKAIVDQWREIARDTAWKDFAGRSPSCANLLNLATAV